MLGNLVHNISFGKDGPWRPVVLVGLENGTNLLLALRADVEELSMETIWISARDIPDVASLAWLLGGGGTNGEIGGLVKCRGEARSEASGSGYKGYVLLVDDAHELAPEVGRAYWLAAKQSWEARALIALVGPPELRHAFRATDVLFWEQVVKADA